MAFMRRCQDKVLSTKDFEVTRLKSLIRKESRIDFILCRVLFERFHCKYLISLSHDNIHFPLFFIHTGEKSSWKTI